MVLVPRGTAASESWGWCRRFAISWSELCAWVGFAAALFGSCLILTDARGFLKRFSSSLSLSCFLILAVLVYPSNLFAWVR
jgi:hypothetical protein